MFNNVFQSQFNCFSDDFQSSNIPQSQPQSAKKQKKPYHPKKRGCAWAFLCYMFEMKQKEGKEKFRKAELMRGANKFSDTDLHEKAVRRFFVSTVKSII